MCDPDEERKCKTRGLHLIWSKCTMLQKAPINRKCFSFMKNDKINLQSGISIQEKIKSLDWNIILNSARAVYLENCFLFIQIKEIFLETV